MLEDIVVVLLSILLIIYLLVWQHQRRRIEKNMRETAELLQRMADVQTILSDQTLPYSVRYRRAYERLHPHK